MTKKIAFFAENLYGGGVERILQIVLCNFDYTKYDVTLYSSRYEKMPKDTYPKNVQHKYYFDTFPGCKNGLPALIGKIINKLKLAIYYKCTPQTFYRLFIRKKYDVGIAFIEGYATRIVSGAPEGMRKLAWIHIELDTFHWTKVAYRSKEEEIDCYKVIDEIACVSQVVKTQAEKLFNRPVHTHVVHNPIDVNKIISLANAGITPEYAIKQYPIRIIALGTLNKRKSFDRLLTVIKKLRQDGYQFETLILGEGPEYDNLQAYINDNNLQTSVKLVGYVDNPYPFIQSSDVYVCSSYAEGYNTAVSEAIILGKAVVSTEVSGIREQLGNKSEYGIITDNTTESLYEGLRHMLSGDNIQRYKAYSQERSVLFNLNQQMQTIYNLIES